MLAGIVAGGAVVAGGLVALPSAQAALTSNPTTQDRQADFAAAAKEFHVPLDVLLGVSYQESLWDAHGGQYNTSGGYGPMNLTDVTSKMVSSGAAGAAGRGDIKSLTSSPSLHTLAAAAKLTGASENALRTDDHDNIRGGAALLASYEKKLTGGTTPTDPSAWYGAVARYSQSPDQKSAGLFADRVYKSVKSGVSRKTQDGQSLKLAATPSVSPSTSQLSKLDLKSAPATTATECPTTVDCTFLPAAATNGQVANRPTDGVDIKYIVIHDTESSYDAAIDTFQKSGSADSAHYVMRASDGAVTQMTSDKDIAYHAGNYWFNMHSIGIEHEGFAAQGASWYPQTQYQATAELVKYLAAKYDIPLDRQHIIGHDNVPGPQDSYVAGMHWDPGPYWDWSSFMNMVGEHVGTRTGRNPEVGSAVTITPPFADNKQTVRVCPADDPSGKTTACTDRSEPANFLPVRTAPDADAPLFTDPAVHPGADGKGTDEINDWGSTVQDGQQFVVAGQSGDWTAIWFSGAKVWFYNPGGRNTMPAQGVTIVKPTGDKATLFGSGYPQASEYPSGLSPSAQEPLTVYSFPAGQAYVATQPPVSADDFFATGDKHVTGAAKYYTIQYNHRVVLVDGAGVAPSPAL
ncbi:peptidoglycan recognition protein family protein [Streptomyces sp. 8L]|uniref:peptidoglycan recognition protein family protein n=1 Tax=Streptomyces sp. 8L TaxID=2877242 RepID=UPI001CD5F612|nr:peptidoglycan recognition family protein [Streptomyces sp. 8L]MCA1218323.1 N-acetylmuramoyl-L-alanine amidase [Streptomyces sp. 8L]